MDSDLTSYSLNPSRINIFPLNSEFRLSRAEARKSSRVSNEGMVIVGPFTSRDLLVTCWDFGSLGSLSSRLPSSTTLLTLLGNLLNNLELMVTVRLMY